MPVIEARRRWLYIRSRSLTVWAHWHGSATPAFPHPRGHRWGVHSGGGERFLYAGPLHLILSPPEGG